MFLEKRDVFDILIFIIMKTGFQYVNSYSKVSDRTMFYGRNNHSRKIRSIIKFNRKPKSCPLSKYLELKKYNSLPKIGISINTM